MRFLALDPGEKRTGLAIGDDETDIVTPLPPVVTTNMEQRLSLLARVIEQQGPDALVLGLPLHMDGSEGLAAQRTRRLGEQLAERLDLAVHYMDERLTSAAADARLAGSGLTHRQKRRRHDGQAAAVILKDFLDRRRAG